PQRPSDLPTQRVYRPQKRIAANLPFLERHSLWPFVGRGLLNPIEHTRDVSTGSNEAGVVMLSLENRDRKQHHLGVVGVLGDELFGVVEGAIIIAKLLESLDKAAI